MSSEIEQIRELYHLPLLELIHQAAVIHRQYHDPAEIQVCSLISIKTGGCPENCKYCPQSSHYQTHVNPQPLMQKEEIIRLAHERIQQGATRICLGAAWREVRNSPQFTQILEIIKEVADLGVEVCCCLGMLNEEQARRLKDAGLYAYNHNLDTSERFYQTIITTRTYQDRLNTLEAVKKSGLNVCCGGIIGMGEDAEDRIAMLHTIATRDPYPDSVPINILQTFSGTPLEGQERIPTWELIRTVATARIIMPKAMVRLSAGRVYLSHEEQALCFLAGANSIHSGGVLLTLPTQDFNNDAAIFSLFGLRIKPSMAGRI